MASVSDVSERYQSLARRIDPEVIRHMGPVELTRRIEAAGDLLEGMAYAKDDQERNRLRKGAELILNAVSLKAWIPVASMLSGAAADARKRGDDKAALRHADELARWLEKQPQPGLSDRAVIEEILGVQQAAVRKPQRWFTPWRKR